MATILGNQVLSYHDSVMQASRTAVGCWDMHKPTQEAILTAPGVVASIGAVLHHQGSDPGARQERLNICQSMLQSMGEVVRAAETLREHQFEVAGLPQFQEAMNHLRALLAAIEAVDDAATATKAEKHRSPAAALDPWEYTEEGAAVLQQIIDPANPLGKAVDQGAPAPRADSSVIRRFHS